MSYQVKNYRLRRDADRWDAEVVARFDCAIQIGEEPFTDDLVLREMELTERNPGIFRVASPATEGGPDAFSLPSHWEAAIREMAVAKHQRTRLFIPGAIPGGAAGCSAPCWAENGE